MHPASLNGPVLDIFGRRPRVSARQLLRWPRSLSSQYHGAMKQDKSRVPALLAALLSFTAMMLGLRCWTLSNENADLESQVSDIAEALQISVAAQENCAQTSAAAHKSEKHLLEDLTKMRSQWEKLRGQVALNKPRLEEGDLCTAARKECTEQLISARQSDESKDDVIKKLRTEAQQLRSDTLGLVACREQLEQAQQTHSKLYHLQNGYAEENEAIHRDAESRGAVGKRNKGPRRKKKRPHVIVEEPVDDVKKVDDDIPTEELGYDEDTESKDVVVADEPLERVAAPRRSKSTTTTTTTEMPLAADEVQEEEVSKSTTAARGARPMVRVVV